MKTTFKKSQSSTSAFQNLINNEDEALRNECEAIFLTTFKSISEDITTAEDLILCKLIELKAVSYFLSIS